MAYLTLAHKYAIIARWAANPLIVLHFLCLWWFWCFPKASGWDGVWGPKPGLAHCYFLWPAATEITGRYRLLASLRRYAHARPTGLRLAVSFLYLGFVFAQETGTKRRVYSPSCPLLTLNQVFDQSAVYKESWQKRAW